MTDDRMDGYFTEVDYPARLVEQVTPAHVVAAAAWQGIAAPDLSRPFRMLDIGCGSGAALVLAAASHPAGSFEGIDGMKSHVRAGQRLAEGLGNVTFRHAVFREATAEAAPDCDLIVMHGVLSWAGAAAREEAMDLAQRRLAPGGLLAVSYNALPGSAPLMAIQHVLRRAHAEAEGDPVARLHVALARLREMADAGFPALDPASVRRLVELSREEPAEYFLHEYLHDHWAPFWPFDIRARLEARGLVKAGTLDILRTRPDLCLTLPERRAAGGADEELLLDMALATGFRSDLFARDPVRSDAARAREGIWIGARRGAEGTLPEPEVRAPCAAPDQTAIRALLVALGDGPRPVPELLAVPGGADALDWLLIGGDAVALGPPSDAGAAARSLNARLCEAALAGNVPIPALAGSHGPVAATVGEMAVARLSAAMLRERARHDPGVARRLLPDAKIGDSALAASLDQVRRRLGRMGALL